MFFILSKVLSFLTLPFFWVCLFLVLSLFLKKDHLKKRYRKLGVGFLLFFSNGFIVEEVYRWWEIPATHIDNIEHYDCAIVLGGMTNRYDAKNDRVSFHGGVDRILQTLVLQKNHKVENILLSSGSGYLLYPEEKESIMVRDYLNHIDYDLSKFWIESESRNTHENAEFSKNFLIKKYGDQWKDKRYLLITSGYHLRRAMGCFEKQGFEFDVYSTNLKSGPRTFELSKILIPNVGAMSRWSSLAHEIIGYVSYAMMGYL